MNARSLEVLKVAGHGSAITAHVLGGVCNWLEAETWKDWHVLFHALGFGFSFASLINHIRKANA